MQQVLYPIVDWMYQVYKSEGFDNYPDLRRAAYFVLGFGGSTRIISTPPAAPSSRVLADQFCHVEIENLPMESQDEIVQLCVYGMNVLNRDVAKNALVSVALVSSSFTLS
jgi:hypothetical protein